MSFRTMQFEGMTIGNIESDGETATVQIDYAVIVKNMDDAEQDTKWHGKGILSIGGLALESGELPSFPAIVTTADVKDNQMTYRNDVVIPINFHGNVGISIQFEGCDQSIKFVGEKMTFDLSEQEKYIQHI